MTDMEASSAVSPREQQPQAKSASIRPISIASQIRIGFFLVLLLMVALGGVELYQVVRIWQGTEGLYEHPHAVRRALGEIKADILSIHNLEHESILTDSAAARVRLFSTIDSLEFAANRQFDILTERYLGPKTDIDAAYGDFVSWRSVRDETFRVLRAGMREEAISRAMPGGADEVYVKKMLDHITVIDNFSRTRADAFYHDAREQKNRLIFVLISLAAASIGASFFIISILLRRLATPLAALERAAREFTRGNMAARSGYTIRNEFGVLSDAFNEMASGVEATMEHGRKSSELAAIMLGEDDARKFFNLTLSALAAHTASQMAAVYLIADDWKSFELFESIGLSGEVLRSFSAATFEGEFGLAISTGKMQHIRAIPPESRLQFRTVGGTFVPVEILTVPILSGKEIIAVISLANITPFTGASIRFVEDTIDMLSARISGVLMYQKTKELTEQLKNQNRELQAQQNELAAQSNELTAQNRELERQKEQLSEASRLKTTFLSNMSHELRTPLNSVIALSGVLNRRLAGKLPAEEYGYLEVIERNGKMLLSLINDILDIARIEAGREEIEVSRFVVRDLVMEMVDMLKPQAEQKSIVLNYRSDGAFATIESDRDKCRHILQNIMGNAVKFTEKGSVDVGVHIAGDYVEIRVTDTGIGITADQITYIFDEFRQADGSTSRRFGGTGLGLSIAKKYAALLRGSIAVSSEPGKGSTFSLRLPFKTGAGDNSIPPASTIPPVKNVPLPEEGSAAARATGKGLTVMLVEDSEPAIIQLTDMLGAYGYRIVVARGGAEALRLLDHEMPDAILLDLMMPEVDGFAVLETIRNAERSAQVPVLVLTAKHITREDLRHLRRNNIHQLVQKGDVKRDELIGAVAAMVKRADPAPVPAPAPETQVIIGKPVVLVVEDNPDNMLTFRALLADDYLVLEASDGEAGLKLAKSRIPHVVLMDISLPGKDGIGVFRELRNNPATMNIPVIAVTASAMSEDRETILSYGFDDYIPKPVDAETLHRQLRKALYGK